MEVYILTVSDFGEGKRCLLGVYSNMESAEKACGDLDEELFGFPNIEKFKVTDLRKVRK